ncbi:MAG: hypothetical protein Q9166_000220 [cf. Caloplaca sp. 2 TL-2023]
MGQLLSTSRKGSEVKSQQLSTHEDADWNLDESFFHYTSGRWLFNEAKQLAKRRVKFDMNKLALLAAESVGSHSCRKVVKFAEGDLNKIFLMTTDDGKEIIVKVPHPNVGRPDFTISSEVATMDYVRNVLGLPVPKVHAWSSKATTNPVGAEFIVMEKAPGIELQHVWQDLDFNQKSEVVKAVVEQETKLTTSTFYAVGSLYYAKQFEDATSVDAYAESGDHRFVVGPTTERWFFNGGRGSRTEDYLVAIGRREMSAVKNLKHVSQSLGIFGGPGYHQPSINTKIACLRDYIKIAKYLPPRKDPSVSAAFLWHPDLHAENIFVDPQHPTYITCIIDWQSVSIRPLFRHAGHPAFLDFDGPKPMLGIRGDAKQIPNLPGNYQELSQEDQKAAQSLVHQQKLYKMYEMYCALQNPSVHNALQFGETVQGNLITLIDLISNHSELTVQAFLMELESGWDQIWGPDGPPCPIHYSELDRNLCAEEYPKWMDCNALLDAVHKRLGVDSKGCWDGLVTPEGFSAQKEVLEKVREEFLDQAAKDREGKAQWARVWPFKDDDDMNGQVNE